MNSTDSPSKLEQQLREMNEALLVSSLRQHELAEQAQRTEGAARASEDRYRSLFDSAPMALFVCDRNAIIQQYNARAVELWGREPVCGVEQHCGSTKLWLPDGTLLPHPESPVVEVLRVGVPAHNVEVYIERPNGSRLPVLVNFAPLKNAQGEITGAVTSFIDISERKQAEEALRESEERFRAIADNIPQLAWMADGEGWVGWFNQGWLDYTGTTLEENQGLGWKAVHHPDYVDDVAEKFMRHLREGRDWEDTFPLRGKDGRYRWFLSRMKAIRDESGKVVRFFGTNTDVTEQRAAAEALTLSEKRYRHLFESAKDGIVILDARTGKITDANACMGDLMETEVRKLLGKELWEIGLFSDRVANKAALRELREQGYVRYANLPLESEHGRRIEVEVVANAYSEEHYSIIQCNLRDITERSRLERETHEQAETLAELHQRKDEFLAMLSHELRNPLSAIFNALHVLRLEDTGNPIQQKAKSIIERQVGQLAHLVDDLLEVSRVITGGIQLHQERLEMRGIVDRAIESARPLIDRHKHELSVSLPAEPIWLQGDPTRLEQVVVNLLNNAAKYTDEGGQIRLTVQQEGAEVVLRVRDTGVGIAPELLPRIFDLFTQADRTLDRSQGGLGIGLSLVQKLVELHDGTVVAHSAGLGQGSEFIVRLPALFPASEPIAPIATAKPPEQTSRVVVVDDNIDAADMLAMMLQMFGHEVKPAYSGETALELALEYQPDCVLLDIGLPDMNGYEVARRLRQLPQTKDMWLIAMTGYGQESDRKLSQEAGFDRHLVKPVEPQKLRELLETLAKQPRPGNE